MPAANMSKKGKKTQNYWIDNQFRFAFTRSLTLSLKTSHHLLEK